MCKLLSVTLSVRSHNVLHLLGRSGGQNLNQHLLICPSPLRYKHVNSTSRIFKCLNNGNIKYSSNVSNVTDYLDGIAEGCHIIGERWRHQSHNKGLKLTSQLSLQVSNQVLNTSLFISCCISWMLGLACVLDITLFCWKVDPLFMICAIWNIKV